MNAESGTPNSSDARLAAVIVSTLDRSSKPLSLNQLQDELRGSHTHLKDRVPGVMKDLQASGQAFEWVTSSRVAYWNKAPLIQVRTAILDATRIESLTVASLKSVAFTAYPSLSSSEFNTLFTHLIDENLIFEQPPARKGGHVRYTSEPPSLPTLDSVLLEKMKRGRWSEPSLFKALVASRCETSYAEMNSALIRLEKMGRVFKYPPIKKSAGLKWSRRAPNLAAQFTTLTTMLEKRAALIRLGFDEALVDAAIRSKLPSGVTSIELPDSLADRLLLTLKIANQPVMSLHYLRVMFNVSKGEFDATIMNLRNANRVELFCEDHPLVQGRDWRFESLTETSDRFYLGIALV